MEHRVGSDNGWLTTSWTFLSRCSDEVELGDLTAEARGEARGRLHAEAQQKWSTLGDRKMKTQGSMMELMERKRRALSSAGWDSLALSYELR